MKRGRKKHLEKARATLAELKKNGLLGKAGYSANTPQKLRRKISPWASPIPEGEKRRPREVLQAENEERGWNTIDRALRFAKPTGGEPHSLPPTFGSGLGRLCAVESIEEDKTYQEYEKFYSAICRWSEIDLPKLTTSEYYACQRIVLECHMEAMDQSIDDAYELHDRLSAELDKQYFDKHSACRTENDRMFVTTCDTCWDQRHEAPNGTSMLVDQLTLCVIGLHHTTKRQCEHTHERVTSSWAVSAAAMDPHGLQQCLAYFEQKRQQHKMWGGRHPAKYLIVVDGDGKAHIQINQFPNAVHGMCGTHTKKNVGKHAIFHTQKILYKHCSCETKKRASDGKPCTNLIK
jgi:hypothetical protein